jgi:hypothetical protein
MIISSIAITSYGTVDSSNKLINHFKLQTDGVILIVAFPTEFYDYESNYTFFCPGRGMAIWITPDVKKVEKICGAVLQKDNFYGIALPLIVLGIKVRDT